MFRLAILLSCILGAAWPSTANAQAEVHGVQTEGGTWVVPAGVSRITIEAWGAGGGGAGGGSGVVAGGPGGGGGGGGSGAYLRASLAVKEGETYTIRIGARGAGGRGESQEAAQPGGDGEDTTILRDNQVLLFARGGRGGRAPKRGDLRGGAGGGGGLAERASTHLVQPGNSGGRGGDGGFADWDLASGGTGGAAVAGTFQPSGSFGGAGGVGRPYGHSEDGTPGGQGSVVITW